jgi:hypothetical protein
MAWQHDEAPNEYATGDYSYSGGGTIGEDGAALQETLLQSHEMDEETDDELEESTNWFFAPAKLTWKNSSASDAAWERDILEEAMINQEEVRSIEYFVHFRMFSRFFTHSVEWSQPRRSTRSLNTFENTYGKRCSESET